MSSRDLALGAALRSLDVPDHAPGFYAQLHARLSEGRLASLDDVRRRRRARQARLRWAARVGAIAAAAAVALLFFLPRDERAPEVLRADVASAAAIKAKVRRALASAENLSGELIVRGRRYENAYGWDAPQRWRFAMTARGDLRIKGLTLVDSSAYDASTGVERTLNPSASMGGDALFAAERKGIAPGPPDPGPSDSLLQTDFGSFVRALLAADDARVDHAAYEGRPAWRLEIPAAQNLIVPEFSGDEFAITVDQATGIPVRVVERKNGVALDELRIEGLAVDTQLPRDAFTIEFPPDVEVMRIDDGFRRVALAEVHGIVGYSPLVPDWVPDGYELTEVAVASESAQPTGVEGSNPESSDVVSLSYRRGLDQFLVTTRLSRVEAPGNRELPLDELWSDPLATGEGYPDEPEKTTLGRGALEDVEAELLIVPRNTPHLWALTDELVVTVSGDLSRAELIRIAESLERQP